MIFEYLHFLMCNSFGFYVFFVTLRSTVIDEVWQEQTLMRLLKVVELPFLEGVLQGCHAAADPVLAHLPAHSDPELDSIHLDRHVLKAFRDRAG